MKLRVLAGVVVVAAGVALAAGRYDLVRVVVTGQSDVRALEAAGCVVNGPDRDGRMLVEVPYEKLGTLAAAGWQMETLKPDIRAFYHKNGQDARFHTYSEMKDTFLMLAATHPAFCRFESLGLASNESLYYALKITSDPDSEEDKPEAMFEGAVHGDEKCGTEAVFNFAEYLVTNYGVDPEITYLINTREIWIISPANPYGHINEVRENANGVDLNRDWGYMWYHETGLAGPFTQPETQMMVGLALTNEFNAWTEYHGGTYMISTPWSYTEFGTRDSNELQYIASQWAIYDGDPYGPGWRVMYQINGCSKDYEYGTTGGYGQSVECCIYKTPPAESLEPIITRERNAMKNELVLLDRGIRGIVTDSATGAPVRARVLPMPQDFPSFCDRPGDYHRFLLPGSYSVRFEANGYRPKTVDGVVVTADTVTRLDVRLVPDTTLPVTLNRFMFGEGVSDAADSSTPDLALGPHDGRRFSLGQGGNAAFDFGQQIFNLPGNDFTVYEGDADPEGYWVQVANNWLGPWTGLGNATGTHAFDLGSAGVSTCRYIRIIDDSSASSGATAGFDLDAVEAITSNVAAVVYQDKVVLDSPPGGNNDGKLDPGETADLVVELRNVGRQPAADVNAVLSTADAYVAVLDSDAAYGTLAPDSAGWNWGDRFRVAASASCPREHAAAMKLVLHGTGYEDSTGFALVVGELRSVDPIPDGPRQPPLYWAFDNVDSSYSQHPAYQWAEIAGTGTQLTLGDDQTQTISLPAAFGPFRFYGQSYTQVSVCSNGWVAPGSTTLSAYTNTGLPSGAMPPLFAALWDDLNPGAAGSVWYYHDAANHRFIVEYDSVPHWGTSTYEKFEVILSDTTRAAADGNCEFAYQYALAGQTSTITVGEQDPTLTIAIQALYDGSYHRAAAPIVPGRAIRFTTDYLQAIAAGSQVPDGQRVALTARPNPWSRGVLGMTLSCARPGPARLSIHDAAGRLVREFVLPAVSAPGRRSFAWDGRDAMGREAGAGAYVVRFETALGTASAKVVKLR